GSLHRPPFPPPFRAHLAPLAGGGAGRLGPRWVGRGGPGPPATPLIRNPLVTTVADVTNEPTTGGSAGAGLPDEPRFNPFEPGFAEDPYPQYLAICQREPVQQTPLGLWAIFDYDDAVKLLRDPRLSVEDKSVRGVNPRAELRQQILGTRPERGTHQILNLDPPDHTRLRALVQKVFTPRTVEQLAPRVQVLVDDALDTADRRGGDATMDVIADLAFPLPFLVISEMLGMPDADRDQLRDWAHTLTLALEPLLAIQHQDEILAASDHMTDHVLDVIEWKRAHPADDLLSALIAAEEGGDTLSPAELLDQVILLYVAGHETTVNLIGNGTLALLRNRGQLERWQTDPSIDSNAVDELLRYDSPVQFSRRVTTTAVELGDHTIEPGVFVLACLASANRDPARWGSHAATLELARPGAAQQLAFGSGIHHCLGAALARLEGRTAIGTLIRRFPDIELATDTPAWNGRLVLRGLDELPVILRT
ncbi:MAG: cytochrome P450, partial [Candidatus Eisenbacteria bacterium]